MIVPSSTIANAIFVPPISMASVRISFLPQLGLRY
ncbi:Uncharacterised protein [Vibrio cholerae]|nr:Uncharacterised protein [Vibrio cholerae]